MTAITVPSQQRRQRTAWILNAALSHIQRQPGCRSICRASVAHYDPVSDMVSALAHAGEANNLLDSYQQPLAAMPGLALLASGPGERVVHDIPPYCRDGAPHLSALRLAGFRSSMTISIPGSDVVTGFLFLNSKTAGTFAEPVLRRLTPVLGDLTGHLHRELTRPGR